MHIYIMTRFEMPRKGSQVQHRQEVTRQVTEETWADFDSVKHGMSSNPASGRSCFSDTDRKNTGAYQRGIYESILFGIWDLTLGRNRCY